MNHLSEEELVDLFYSKGAGPNEHVGACAECRRRFLELKESLEAWRDYPVPERGESYGQEVWARLAPALEKRKRNFLRLWLLAPAFAAMLVAGFVIGIWTEHKRSITEDHSRERVLLMAMSDHLERSQILLTQLQHATPATFDLSTEREQARDLLDQNRLLRQSAIQLGDRSKAAVLDDLERVLLSVANAPPDSAGDDMKMLQERVESERLLWKVRITSSNAREKGQKL
ncbi:MAG TPA: hypothetical protein VH477_07825 [Bryobacteraceae bacterium]